MEINSSKAPFLFIFLSLLILIFIGYNVIITGKLISLLFFAFLLIVKLLIFSRLYRVSRINIDESKLKVQLGSQIKEFKLQDLNLVRFKRDFVDKILDTEQFMVRTNNGDTQSFRMRMFSKKDKNAFITKLG